jgi:hypothetical protein
MPYDDDSTGYRQLYRPSAYSRGSGANTAMMRLCTQVLNVRLEGITTSVCIKTC